MSGKYMPSLIVSFISTMWDVKFIYWSERVKDFDVLSRLCGM